MQNKYNASKNKLVSAQARLDRTTPSKQIDPRQTDWVNKLMTKTKEIK